MKKETENIKVYIIEDHQVMIEGYKALFEPDNITVVGFSLDGADTIEWLQNNHCDVVLLDINMGVVSGLDLLKLITENQITAKVIMASGLCESTYVRKAIDFGSHGYVVKSDNYLEIVNAIKQVHNGENYFSEAVREIAINNAFGNSDITLVTEILTDRETEICKFLMDDKTNEEISSELYISESTIRSTTNKIRAKLNVANNMQLINKLANYKKDLGL